MTAAAWRVDLHSRGRRQEDRLIRITVDVGAAVDDVAAAVLAKADAASQFPHRDVSTWYADEVEHVG